MKWQLIIILLITLFPIVYGMEECQRVIEPEDIPCKVISSWVYSTPCVNHTVSIYNQSGGSLETLTLKDYGSTGLCVFNFTHNTKGTYNYNISSGDTGIIVVKVTNMIIGIIIGIAVICAVMLWFASMLSEQHIFLKAIIIMGSIYLVTLIPAAFIINDVEILLQKTYMRLIYLFAIYIFVYLMYAALVKLGAIVPGENKNNG